jgi:SAM-dependent methyltransferase
MLDGCRYCTSLLSFVYLFAQLFVGSYNLATRECAAGPQMSYYDTFAKKWHAATGDKGGAFKELVLNDLLLHKLPPLGGRSILELGAGNGYFLPLALRGSGGQPCPGGQRPARVVVSDQSEQLLSIARRHFNIPGAEYQKLDVRGPFPFADGRFDLVLASMLFNEVPSGSFRHALGECRRVLARGGMFLMTVLHPDFVNSLLTGGEIRREPDRALTMPGAGSLRLPVVIRSVETYWNALASAGFEFEVEPVYASEAVLNMRPGLRNAGSVPVALVFTCTANTPSPNG